MGMINGSRIVDTMIDGSLGGAALETLLGTAANLASFREAINNRRIARALVESTNAMTALTGSNTAMAAAGLSSVLGAALAANKTAAQAIFASRTAMTAMGNGISAINAYRVWTDKGTNSYWANVASNGTTLVGTGNGNGVVATSTDGIAWTGRTNPTGCSPSPGGLVYGAGVFVGITNSGAATTAAMSSTDGITWTARSYSSTSLFKLGFASWGPTPFFVAVGSTTSTWQYSTNGTAWATFSAAVAGAATDVLVTADRELLLVQPTTTTNVTWNSAATAPATRTNPAHGLGTTPTHAGFINGVYYIAAANSLRYSTDRGLSWSATITLPQTLGSGTYAPNYPAVHGKVVMSTNQNGVFLSSYDGITWVAETFQENGGSLATITQLGGVAIMSTTNTRVHHTAP